MLFFNQICCSRKPFEPTEKKYQWYVDVWQFDILYFNIQNINTRAHVEHLCHGSSPFCTCVLFSWHGLVQQWHIAVPSIHHLMYACTSFLRLSFLFFLLSFQTWWDPMSNEVTSWLCHRGKGHFILCNRSQYGFIDHCCCSMVSSQGPEEVERVSQDE